MRKLSAILLVLIAVTGTSQIRLLCYNLLNFPTGNLQGRTDTLENIIEYARPHLLMIQELKTAQGLMDITEMMNDLNYGDFAHSTFISQQSPGSPGNLLQQAIVYDTEVFRMRSEGVVLTSYRDINEYVLYLNDPQLSAGADTTFLHVYVTHLKSSTGADNEQVRLDMVNYLVDHFNTLPENSNVIFAGDFNVYTTSEPAFQAILNVDNNVVMEDPFASFGDWAVANFGHREILTQSTRSSQINNDGAGGGVDDRFDFILFSEALMNPDNPLHFAEGSFKSLGNTGLCYNENITDCDANNPVPMDVLRSIYFMSDHIPQYCELDTDIINSIIRTDTPKTLINARFTGADYNQIQIEATGFNGQCEISLTNMTGRKIITQGIADISNCIIPIPALSNGVYLLTVVDVRGQYQSVKLSVIR
jgi:endonuclease/exonuclease/phosphatase family metal-dependent hydrolase